jgi:NitT/TauT family transport system substrate-binding protein
MDPRRISMRPNGHLVSARSRASGNPATAAPVRHVLKHKMDSRVCGNERWIGGLLASVLAFTAAGVLSATAADHIRVGKASSTTFAFAPIEIGTEKGIWAKYGLEVESIGFGGDARLQQAMVANSIHFSLGSGPGMGFIAKGVPAITVAAMANEPLAMGLTIGKNSPLKNFDDLKGATVSVSTGGSLTMWLTREFSRQRGWGPAGIKTVPLGVNPAQVAALKAGNVQGIVTSSSVGYMLEKSGEGRVLVEFGEHVKDFHTHVIFATNEIVTRHPDQVRRFLAGWKDVIAFLAANRDETIRLVAPISGLAPDIQAREYDKAMPMMSRDLRFLPKAVEVLARSFVELEILPVAPDMKTLYTEQFLSDAR